MLYVYNFSLYYYDISLFLRSEVKYIQAFMTTTQKGTIFTELNRTHPIHNGIMEESIQFISLATTASKSHFKTEAYHHLHIHLIMWKDGISVVMYGLKQTGGQNDGLLQMVRSLKVLVCIVWTVQ